MLLGHKLGISIYDPKGKLTRTVSADEPSAFFLDERTRLVTVRKDSLMVERGEITPMRMPMQDKPKTIDEIPSALAMSSGARLIADKKGKQVLRFAPNGTFVGKFAGIEAGRLALNHLDDVAMIDREKKSVAIFDRDGKQLANIPQKGTGYELDNPIDLAYDAFGQLYVLDRGKASVYVFGPKNNLLTTVTIPEKSPGAFTKADAFAIDKAGRMYIYDDKAQSIQVYQ